MIDENGLQHFMVGGFVRDQILGRPSHDLDWVVVGETAESMISRGFTPIHAAEFPIFIDPETRDEYALARRERKTGVGYMGFEVFSSPDVTLEDDLSRRDLTMNSIAYDGFDYVDPFGGIQDIIDRVLRHTSLAFKEDPVRILRIARFMAELGDYGFTVHPDTLELMCTMVAEGEVDHLTAERVWKETEKALRSNHPERFFETLQVCGALKVLMPELDNLVDVEQPVVHHPEVCTFRHVMMCLQQAVEIGSRNPVINFAVLMHDLGKALSPKETLPAHHGHEEAGIPLVEAFCDRLKVPTEFRQLALKVCEHHQRCHKALEMRPVKIENLLEKIGAFKNTGAQMLTSFLIACSADAKGRLGFEDRAYPQAKFLEEMWIAVQDIDMNKIVEKYKGQGAVIGHQIRQARVNRIAEAAAQWKMLNR